MGGKLKGSGKIAKGGMVAPPSIKRVKLAMRQHLGYSNADISDRPSRRDQKVMNAAEDSIGYYRDLAADFRDMKMDSTAKDFDTAADHIDGLLGQLDERGYLIDDLLMLVDLMAKKLAAKGGE